MKKLLTTSAIFLVLFLSHTSNIISQSWVVQTTGVFNTLWSASFPHSDTGYAVGTGGTVIKTVNGGSNWTSLNTPTGNLLHHVYFISGSLGWAVGHSGTTIKTTNGGLNWQSQNSFIGGNLFYVHFVHRNYGWACGDNGVISTTDGGTTWVPSLAEQWVYSIYFVNVNTGWAGVRFGKMFKTTNGGSNWVQQTTGTLATAFGMQFLNENTGWAVGDYNSIIKTTNGGNTWFHQDYELGGFSTTSRSVSFVDSQKGWIVGYNGLILRTTNGGTNWVKISAPVNVDYLSIRIKGIQGWAVGGNGTVLYNDNVTTVTQTGAEVPAEFKLQQNYPNPFNPATKIQFGIPQKGFTTLKIYDILGKEISSVVSEVLDAGSYDYQFNGENLNSGVYYYVLRSDDFIETKKMMLVK